MPSLIRHVIQLQAETGVYSPKEIGLVPTMGNLHDGHLSLIRESLAKNKITIVTIFVNPKQFGPNEDFDKYPRTLESDMEKISSLKLKEDQRLFVFAPDSNDQIYLEGFSTTISIKGITDILCGASRPGHFDGVTTVVYQLFKISNAGHAYFGQKDYQQVKVIERMVTDLRLDIDLNMIPIARDKDGLALSSRNQYLDSEERKEALKLPNKLKRIDNFLKETTWMQAYHKINQELEETLADHRWDYLEILDADNLQEVNSETKKVAILAAYKSQNARLIDNRLVDIVYA